MIRRGSQFIFPAALLGLALALPLTAAPQTGTGSASASFTIDASLGSGAVRELPVTLRCTSPSGDVLIEATEIVGADESAELRLPDPPEGGAVCSVTARTPAGLRIRYRGDGGSLAEVDDKGCRFSNVAAGHANFCLVQLEVQSTSVAVYKKWIGARRQEDDVVARLRCGGEEVQQALRVNAGSPGEWVLDVTDAEGVRCEVIEDEREDFVPDMTDCQDLLVLPGTREECTLVNTKVVKMIDMLNRYGLAVMIAVFAVAGTLAARKFVPTPE